MVLSRMILLSLIPALFGCDESSVRRTLAASSAEQQSRAGEREHVNNEWIGRDFSELVAELGEPQGAIDTTLLGGPPSIGYVYRSTRGDDCIDAFVVEMQTMRIIDYFCR